MRTIAIEHNLDWVPRPNEARPILATRMPPRELITSALALAFADDHLLLAELTHRGWDIPGGTSKRGNAPKMRRAGKSTKKRARYSARRRLSRTNGFGSSPRRPPSIAIRIPRAIRFSTRRGWPPLEPFTGTAECRGRALFAPSDARNLPWMRQFGALYEAALVGSASLPRA